MLSMLLMAFFGLAFSFFAVQNALPVTIQFGEFIIDVPLYLVALAALLIGLLLPWTFYIARTACAVLTAQGKDRDRFRTKKPRADLEHRIRELEAANARLRSEHAPEPRFSMTASGPRK
jgi:uncharacterized integral membrane protein